LELENMPSNYLEELVSEWYEYRGYFVRRNVWVGPLAHGGYECELDVVAFNPSTNHLVHVEPTHDAFSWAKREVRLKKKFEAGKRHIPSLFHGVKLPKKIEQICLLGFGSSANHKQLAGGRVITIAEFLEEILRELASVSMHRKTMSENHPILRTLQFVALNRKRMSQTLSEL